MLAVITAELNLIGPSSVLNGITLKAEELGYTLLIKNLSSFRVDDHQGLIRFINEMRVEGVVWAIPNFDHYRQETIDKITNLSVPIVFQGAAPIENTLDVTIDNHSGGCQATLHLIDQGFRHIAQIAGPLEFWDAEARKSGWVDTLMKHGRPFSDAHWAEGNGSAASGAQAVSALFYTYPEMDAIFVSNDQMAIGAIQTIHERGLRVPNDLAIIGYDDIPESAYVSPPLTTISQDFHLMGAKTIEVLVDAIQAQRTGKEPSSIKPVCLKTELVIRASCPDNLVKASHK